MAWKGRGRGAAFWSLRVLRVAQLCLVSYAAWWTGHPVPPLEPLQDGEGEPGTPAPPGEARRPRTGYAAMAAASGMPGPGHPERLRPDVPLSSLERRLLGELDLEVD